MAVEFEVEGVLQLRERGTFVFARTLRPGADFRVVQGSTLGGIALEVLLEMPRALDKEGKQRMDLFAFQLKSGSPSEGLAKGQRVELRPGDQLEYLEPWVPSKREVAQQLYREVGAQHVLYGARVRTIAHRSDCDDVLFELTGDRSGFAVVHLTFASTPGPDSRWPETRLFANWWDVYEQVIYEDNEYWR